MAPENSPSTESAPLPESTNIHEAAALLDALEENDDAGEANGSDAVRTESGAAGDDGQPENVGEETAVAEGEIEGEGEAEAEAGEGEDAALSEAPEFWSAEDKNILAAAPADVRAALAPVLKKYEQQRIEFVNAKTQEAAKVRQEAIEEAKKATGIVEEGAKWWTENGPQFFKAFGDKWAQVDWNTLARENPAEWAALKQQREAEGELLRAAHERAQRDIETANKRAEAQFQETKRAEHEKVAKDMPEFFGTPERAAKTYTELGQYLFDGGIPAEAINRIHEAPIIKLAMKALLYDRAKKQASVVAPNRDKTTGKFTAETPKRVQPGPGAKATGNRNAELARQVGERFIKSGGRDIRDAAELIRLRGL